MDFQACFIRLKRQHMTFIRSFVFVNQLLKNSTIQMFANLMHLRALSQSFDHIHLDE